MKDGVPSMGAVELQVRKALFCHGVARLSRDRRNAKVDLVPKDVVAKWLKFLRRSHPAIAFKASTQENSSSIKQTKVMETPCIRRWSTPSLVLPVYATPCHSCASHGGKGSVVPCCCSFRSVLPCFRLTSFGLRSPSRSRMYRKTGLLRSDGSLAL